MAILDIRNDFVEGVQEVFTTLFNDGKMDGIDLYLLSDETTNIYGEKKFKTFKPPVKLVAKVNLTPTQEEQDIGVIKDKSTFKVPLKDLQDKNIDVSHDNLEVLRKGIIKFQGEFFRIENILPRTYVEDVFLFYEFVCSEDKQVGNITLEE